jgi:hypothetical protein
MSGTINLADFLTFIVFVVVMTLNSLVYSYALVQFLLEILLFLECFVLYLFQSRSKIY